MNYKLVLLIYFSFLILSCQNKKDPIHFNQAKGWFVNSTVFDSIKTNKSIQKSKSFLDQDAIFLQIKNDSIHTYGTIINRNEHLIVPSRDTIGVIGGMCFADLIYPKEKANLVAHNKYGQGKVEFRKSTFEEEEFLKSQLNENENTHRILEKWFAIQILSGKYINQAKNEIELNQNEESSNFKSYDKYSTHVRNGTLDWMNNDWIKFWNSRTNESEILHYKFEEQYLNLYEYYHYEIEQQYKIGEIKYSWKIIE